MKRPLALLLIFAITFVVPSAGAPPLHSGPAATSVALLQDYEQYDTHFSSDQLENLVAPIALYPDPLLAQVLLAATFPDQIDEAARTVRAYGSGYAIDSAPWDVSVKAVAHYPTVLSMMADKIDWTTSLGQAYVNQSSDVMEAVQHLRRHARSSGYLVNSPQQEILDADGYLYIYPAQPRYIYVPYYDPAIVFVDRPGFYWGSAISFGVGFLIGAWLNHDCDWGHHRVYYHGWAGGGPIWVTRSRSHVRINNIYVNNIYRNVRVNRDVNHRSVNYGALNRYNSVHRGVDYSNVRRARGDAGPRPAPVAPGDQRRDNKIIRRSMDPNDPRIDANRGRGQFPQSQPQVRQPDVARPDERRRDATQPPVRQPDIARPDMRRPGTPQVQQPQTPRPDDRRRQTPQVQQPQVQQPQTPRPEVRRPDTSRNVPATTLPMQVPRTQAPPQQRQPEIQRPQSVFRGGGGGGAGSIDTRSASQRGYESRQQQNRPVQQAPRQSAPQQHAPRQSAPQQHAPQQHAPTPQHSQQGQPRGRGR